MGRNNYFQFKQFKIIQERSAMKVGTDGVLLGAWASTSGAKKILDIGSGTGVIALMMAQRSEAQITGIEIEKNAAEEAIENARTSPWSNRVSILNQSLQDFSENCTNTFDLIVSNPPFFTNSQKSKCQSLAMAKHNHLLPLPELAKGAAKLLTPIGNFALILPVIQAKEFIEMAKNEGLFLVRQTKVYPNRLKPVHRYLMEFSETQSLLEMDLLCIHNENNSNYTEEYKTLTRDFYLNF